MCARANLCAILSRSHIGVIEIENVAQGLVPPLFFLLMCVRVATPERSGLVCSSRSCNFKRGFFAGMNERDWRAWPCGVAPPPCSRIDVVPTRCKCNAETNQPTLPPAKRRRVKQCASQSRRRLLQSEGNGKPAHSHACRRFSTHCVGLLQLDALPVSLD